MSYADTVRAFEDWKAKNPTNVYASGKPEDWATAANAATGQLTYSPEEHGNAARTAIALYQPYKQGIGQVGADIGGAAGSLVGAEDRGAQLGEDYAPSLFAGLAGTAIGAPLGMPMIGMALGTGASTYGETGSPLEAAKAAALNYGAGKAGMFLGGKLAGALPEFASPFLNQAAYIASDQAAFTGVNEAIAQTQSVASGHGLDMERYRDGRSLFENVALNVPFAAADIAGAALRPWKSTVSNQAHAAEQTSALHLLKDRDIPSPTDPGPLLLGDRTRLPTGEPLIGDPYTPVTPEQRLLTDRPQQLALEDRYAGYLPDGSPMVRPGDPTLTATQSAHERARQESWNETFRQLGEEGTTLPQSDPTTFTPEHPHAAIDTAPTTRGNIESAAGESGFDPTHYPETAEFALLRATQAADTITAQLETPVATAGEFFQKAKTLDDMTTSLREVLAKALPDFDPETDFAHFTPENLKRLADHSGRDLTLSSENDQLLALQANVSNKAEGTRDQAISLLSDINRQLAEAGDPQQIPGSSRQTMASTDLSSLGRPELDALREVEVAPAFAGKDLNGKLSLTTDDTVRQYAMGRVAKILSGELAPRRKGAEFRLANMDRNSPDFLPELKKAYEASLATGLKSAATSEKRLQSAATTDSLTNSPERATFAPPERAMAENRPRMTANDRAVVKQIASGLSDPAQLGRMAEHYNLGVKPGSDSSKAFEIAARFYAEGRSLEGTEKTNPAVRDYNAALKQAGIAPTAVSREKARAVERLNKLFAGLRKDPELKLPSGAKVNLSAIQESVLNVNVPRGTSTARTTELTAMASTRAVAEQVLADSGLRRGGNMMTTMLDAVTRTVAKFPEFVQRTFVTEVQGLKRGEMGMAVLEIRKQGKGPAADLVGLNPRELQSANPGLAFRRLQETVGHELFHVLKERAQRLDGVDAEVERYLTPIADLQRLESSMSPEDKRGILHDLARELYPDSPENVQRAADYGSTVDGEFLPTYSGLVSAAMAWSENAGAIADVYRFENRPVQKFFNSLSQTYKNVMESIGKTVGLAKQGLIPDIGRPLQDVRGRMASVFEKLLRTKKEVDAAVMDLESFRAMSSEEELLKFGRYSRPPPIKANYGQPLEQVTFYSKDLRKTGRDWVARMFGPTGAVGRFLGPLSVMAEEFPALRPVKNAILQYRQYAHEVYHRATLQLSKEYRQGRWQDAGNQKFVADVAKDNRLGGPDGLVSAAAREFNVQNKMPSFEDLRTYAQTHGFGDVSTPQLESSYSVLVGMSDAFTKGIKEARLNQVDHNGETAVALLLAKQKPGTPLGPIKLLAEDIYSVVSGLHKGAVDPALEQRAIRLAHTAGFDVVPTAPTPEARVVQILQTMGQDGLYREAFAAAEQGTGVWKQASDVLNNAQFYWPEVRPGKFLISYSKDGQRVVPPGWDSMAAREKAVAALAKEPGIGNIERIDPKEGPALTGGMLDKIDRIEREAIESLRGKIDDDAFTALTESYAPLAASRRAMEAEKKEPSLQKRFFVGGREQLDMLAVAAANLKNVSLGVGRKWALNEATVGMHEPGLQADKIRGDYAKQAIHNTLLSPSTDWNKLQQGVFMWTMALNVGSAAIESTQNFTRLAPFLTAMSPEGTPRREAYQWLKAGAGKWWEFAQSRGFGNVVKEAGAFGQPAGAKESYFKNDLQLDRLWHKATALGIIERPGGVVFADDLDFKLANNARLTEGMAPLDKASSMFGNAWYGVYQFAKNLYSVAPTLSRQWSFLSSVEFARTKLGLKDDAQILQVAQRIDQVTQASGGKADRPVGLFANSGKFAPAVAAAWSLQQYMAGEVALTGLYAKAWINKEFGGGWSSNQARKALTQQQLTYMLTAGIMGLTGAVTTKALAQVVLGDRVDLDREMKQAVAHMTSALPDPLSRWTLDTVMKGLPSTMLPIDISGRIGAGRLFGIDPVGGVNLADVLLGVPGSLARQAGEGLGEVRDGNVVRGLGKLLPVSVRNLPSLLADDGAVRTKSGALLMQPDAGEKVMMALGLQPKRTSEMRSQGRMQDFAARQSAAELDRFYQQLLPAVQSGDYSTVRTELQGRAMRDATFDPRQGLRRLIELHQEQTLPRDVLREGGLSTSAERSQIAAMFPQGTRMPEMDRLQEKANLIQSVGLPGMEPAGAKDFAMARMVDGLLSQSPGMTRAQAVEWVSKMMRKKHGFHRTNVMGM